MSQGPHSSTSFHASRLVAPTAAVAALPPHTVRPLLGHSGMTIERFFSLHIAGIMLPAGAGLLLYGWRGLVVMALVIASALTASAAWGRIGRRGCQMRGCHNLWLAMLLSLMLPAHLGSTHLSAPALARWSQPWMIAVAAGALLATFTWLLGGVGSGRIHPAVLTYLLIAVLAGAALTPHWVLQRTHLFLGDLGKAAMVDTYPSPADGWVNYPIASGKDALYLRGAAERLTRFTTGAQRQDRWLSLTSLLRDEMPPLEDLIIGGQPAAMGASCVIAVIVGGLFLLYRGVIDFRIPLLIYAAAFAAFMVLPVPIVITEAGAQAGGGHTWQWMAFRSRDVGLANGITFANYETMAGPLLFMAFFIATSSAIRPMSRRGRILYALLIGAAAAAAQLYVSASFGPYLAVLLVGLLSPAIDGLFKVRPLV
jgi:Na+-translocating ferredoxin:NAD+ oxidoreductase RnfD subunit